jgi:DNA invertase Pin-like site-specific DNA recombinase
MNAYIYCRVSSERQQEFGVSLEAQEKSCREYCQARNLSVARVVKETASARTTKKQLNLTSFIESLPSEASCLVVYSVSRFSRNVQEGLALVDQLRQKQIMLQSVTENIDLSTPGGEFTFTSLLNAAELESKLISDRVKQGLNYKKSLGNQYGKPLYGKSVKYEAGVRTFVKNENEFRVLRLISYLRTRGTSLKVLNLMLGQLAPEENALEFSDGAKKIKTIMTWKNIAQVLNDYHIRPRHGAAWNRNTVSALRKLLQDTDLRNCSDILEPMIQRSPAKFKSTPSPARTPTKDVSDSEYELSDADLTEDDNDSS